jgi:hypothetical protein
MYFCCALRFFSIVFNYFTPQRNVGFNHLYIFYLSYFVYLFGSNYIYYFVYLFGSNYIYYFVYLFGSNYIYYFAYLFGSKRYCTRIYAYAYT